MLDKLSIVPLNTTLAVLVPGTEVDEAKPVDTIGSGYITPLT